MVAQRAEDALAFDQIEHAGTVGAFVDKVANCDQAVAGDGAKCRKKLFELLAASVHIPYDKGSFQATTSRLLAEPKGPGTCSRSGSGS